MSNTLILNIKNNALVTYENYGFNSIVRCGQYYYGVNEKGIFKLDGESDNGEPIKCIFKTGAIDFDRAELKNVSDVYLTCKTNGNYEISLITHENKAYTYQVQDSDIVIHNKRIKTGKGLKGRFFELVFKNTDGAKVEISEISFTVVSGQRKVTAK